MKRSNLEQENSKHPFILVESNLEILPIFKVTGRSTDITPYTLEWSGDMKDGSRVTKSWTVEPHSQYGAPRGRDQDVFIAVLTLMENRGGMPEDGVVSTTRAELLRILGWPTNGSHYQKLRESLTRIDRTLIASRDAFYHQDSESWFDGSFRIWGVEFLKSRRRKDGRTEELVRIRFADVLIRSFLAAYLKGLDTGFYWSLSSHLAKRMYRLVDRMRGERLEWDVDLFKLQETIPMGPYKYPSKIREKLKPPHVELLEKGFLEHVTFDETSLRMRYRVREEFARHRERFELAESPEGLIAMEMMGSIGMAVAESQRVVADYGPERCLACVQALPYQTVKKTPLAWLRWAVKSPEFDPYPYLRGPAKEATKSEKPELDEEGGESNSELQSALRYDLEVPDPDPRVAGIWEQTKQGADDELESPSMMMWLQETVPTKLEGAVLTLSVPNLYAKQYIETRFRELLERHLTSHLGTEASIEIRARDRTGYDA